jgi:hypothetical protein
MIYDVPPRDTAIDQGDLIDTCPLASVSDFRLDSPDTAKVELDLQRVIALTQTCDLANRKSETANVATVFDAQQLIDRKLLKSVDVQGPIRAGRVRGLYFLPANTALELGEMVIDLRRLHTVQLRVLTTLCQAGKRRGRVRSPYREHLAKHFADTFSRIGLPQPYDTLGAP